MGGWNSKGKREAGNRLDIFWLKKHGYLNKDYSFRGGGIKWTSYYGHESSIGFSVTTDDWGKPEEQKYIRLQYTHTDHYSKEKESVNYRVNLVTTPCQYGGKRYWFICPLTSNGQYCGRRAGTLYNLGKYFGCRHCGNITYASQKASGSYKGFVSIPDIDKAKDAIKRYYYRGKPTRKYKKFLKLDEKFAIGLTKMYMRLGKLYKK